MAKLPVIVSFGGVSPAGRSSFHHGYRRLIIDALAEREVAETYKSLAGLTGREGHESADDRHWLREHSLIRAIETQHFSPSALRWQKPMNLRAEQPLSFRCKVRELPEPLPVNWQVRQTEETGWVEVSFSGEADLLFSSAQEFDVGAAGQLPSGFEPGKLYPSRNHPRGLQMSVYGASDAVQSMGISWDHVMGAVAPDQISVYAGSAMAQLDEQGYAGMLSARSRGKRVTSKQLALGLAEMPADFINAYVLGSVGNTGLGMGACATWLYNLRLGVNDIKTGQARVVLVGGVEAPIQPGAMEGFMAMGALATNTALRELDGLSENDAIDFRRTSRPFSSNCGFTIAEASQFVVLMDDELAMQLGASIHGAVPDVFVNADGHKKSISSPGVGNYLTVAKAAALGRSILGDEALRQRSYVHAHGTGTPQNRVSESHIFNETAKAFGIERWPVAAIKAYVGHSMAAAAGCQTMAALGTWRYGWLPGIKTVDHIAEDVHQSHLQFNLNHREVGPEAMDMSIVNSKGFGGNNASALLLGPHIVEHMLAKKHGSREFSQYQARNEGVQAQSLHYEQRCLAGENSVLYRFGEGVMAEDDVQLSSDELRFSGFDNAVTLAQPSAYAEWV